MRVDLRVLAVALVFALAGAGVGACLVACHTDSPIFTPPKDDPAYHCHRQDGSVNPNATWCFPVDGTHTCCPMSYSCEPPMINTTVPGCEYQGNPDNPIGNLGAAPTDKHAARMSDTP